MPSIRMKLDDRQVRGASGRIKVKLAKACARALNRSASSARTVMTREVAGDLQLKAGVVRERIIVDQAAPTRLTVIFRASDKRIPLVEFGARGSEPSRGRGRGVTAKTPARRYPRAFIARMKSGHRGVFERVNKARLAIRELFGASIARVFVKKRHVGVARAKEALDKNLQHEMRFALQIEQKD